MPASGNAANASTSLSHSTSTAPRTSTPAARRKTALETISAASKCSPHRTLWHITPRLDIRQPRGRDGASHFPILAPEEVKRPVWEVSSTVTPEGELCIGLTNGDYREAHESLIRTMRTLGGPTP